MKKIVNRYYVCIIAVSARMFSCNKLLDVPPQGKLTFENYWASKDQAVASIAGIYSNIGATANLSATAISPVESYIYWGELRGELLTSNPGKLAADQINKENIDNMNPSEGDVTTKYTAFYKIINAANQAITYIPGIAGKDASFTGTDRDHLLGEAYFLRAFSYFWLVRTFKEVPLVLEPSINDKQDYNVPKSSMDALYEQIVEDLTFAKSSLPVEYDSETYNRCRATQYTAACVLADVYLWMAALSTSQSEAKTFYDEAISNCDFVINSRKYVLIPGVNYGQIFSEGGTRESIFETYSNQKLNNQTNQLRNWFTSQGYWMVGSAADGLFSETTQSDYRSTTPPTGPFPEAGTVVSYIASSRYIGKYTRTTNDARWIFYRYPEILFMKAEALAHRYPDDAERLEEACVLVNQVRARAFGISNFPKVNTSSTYEMDNSILDERGREFLGEGKRWFELMRFASRDNYAYKELLVDRLLNAATGVEQLTLAPRIVNPEGWYLPLNGEALSANPNLEQNPYYY